MWASVVRFVTGKDAKDPESILSDAKSAALNDEMGSYADKFDDGQQSESQLLARRKDEYKDLVRQYYNLITDFYEYGWGESFHFAPRFPGETFEASIARHEHYLASRLGLKPGMRVLDAGCGVGGPMRSIARFSGAHVTGVTINEYQVRRARALNRKTGLDKLCDVELGNFMELNRVGEFDAAYAIEATCHAPDKAKCYREIFNALKPGGVFATYEWVMTPKYDPTNEKHRSIKFEIERGDGLPDLPPQSDVRRCMEEAGFHVLDEFDVHVEASVNGTQIPWYATLQGSTCSVSQFKHSKLGRFVTQLGVDVMETLRIAPKGTSQTHDMLCRAADNLALGGELGIFTPMMFVVGRKPL